MIALVTGGFDPLHSGHVEMFRRLKEMRFRIHVGLNSDDWLKRKNTLLLPFKLRALHVSLCPGVVKVFPFDDSDDTALDAIMKTYQSADRGFVFVNDGDRVTTDSIPEADLHFCQDHQIPILFLNSPKRDNSSKYK